MIVIGGLNQTVEVNNQLFGIIFITILIYFWFFGLNYHIKNYLEIDNIYNIVLYLLSITFCCFIQNVDTFLFAKIVCFSCQIVYSTFFIDLVSVTHKNLVFKYDSYVFTKKILKPRK